MPTTALQWSRPRLQYLLYVIIHPLRADQLPIIFWREIWIPASERLHFGSGLYASDVKLPLVEVPGPLLLHPLDRRVLLELVDAQVSPRAEAAHLLQRICLHDRCVHRPSRLLDLARRSCQETQRVRRGRARLRTLCQIAMIMSRKTNSTPPPQVMMMSTMSL